MSTTASWGRCSKRTAVPPGDRRRGRSRARVFLPHFSSRSVRFADGDRWTDPLPSTHSQPVSGAGTTARRWHSVDTRNGTCSPLSVVELLEAPPPDPWPGTPTGTLTRWTVQDRRAALYDTV